MGLHERQWGCIIGCQGRKGREGTLQRETWLREIIKQRCVHLAEPLGCTRSWHEVRSEGPLRDTYDCPLERAPRAHPSGGTSLRHCETTLWWVSLGTYSRVEANALASFQRCLGRSIGLAIPTADAHWMPRSRSPGHDPMLPLPSESVLAVGKLLASCLAPVDKD